MHRNLTLDLYVLRLKLQIQSVNWRRNGMKNRGSLARARALAADAEITRRDLITRGASLFSLPLSSYFFASTVGRLIIHARRTQYVASRKRSGRARVSLILGRNIARRCAASDVPRFHRAARRKHPRRLLAAARVIFSAHPVELVSTVSSTRLHLSRVVDE